MNIQKDRYYCATAKLTDKFICINTQSGYGLLTIDPNFTSYKFLLDVNNHLLGEAVLKSLSNSNTVLSDKEYEKMFDPDIAKDDLKLWINDLKISYDYSSRKNYFLR